MTTWQGNRSDRLRPGQISGRETFHAGQLDDHRHCGERTFTVNRANRRNGPSCVSGEWNNGSLFLNARTGSCCRSESGMTDGREPAKNTHGRSRHLPTISSMDIGRDDERRRRSMTTWQGSRSDCLRPGQISVGGKLSTEQ